MATEKTSRPQIERLNAFVDGELTPAERAEVAAQIRAQPSVAHAHAALARLKACIGETAETAHPIQIVLPSKRSRGKSLASAAAGIVMFALGFLAPMSSMRIHNEYQAVPADGRELVVMIAALPSQPVIPQLDDAGLILTDIKLERVAEIRLLVASYRGPHGCRLDMRVSPAGSDLPSHTGTSHHRWTVGPLDYELVAHGMPNWRFAIISFAAEHQSREASGSESVRHRLREARAYAPCTS